MVTEESVLFFVVVTLCTRHVAADIHFMKGAPHAKLANGGLLSGTVQFSRDGRPYNAFVGIPYATIPERFHEPVPITNPPWKDVFSATKPSPICPQNGFFGKNVDSEDCLSLNVYVPMNTTGPGKKGYPIMFWIHGGGFMFGNGFEFGPKYFMDEPVVLITLNYRLGVLGFLSTEDSVSPGNNGLKDIVVALQWVQANIKEFGGDPGKVTVFGESAGGSAVHYLLLSPLTKGLFHRAISQSGSALNPFAFTPSPRQTAVELATYLKCATTAEDIFGITSQEIVSCLRALSLAELIDAQTNFKPSWPLNIRNFNFLPSVEPNEVSSSLTPFLSQSPISILTDTTQNLTEIPWMTGVVQDEGAFFADLVLTTPEVLKQANENWDAIAPLAFDFDRYTPEQSHAEVAQKIKAFYFKGKQISEETRAELTNLYSDDMFVNGIIRAALETSSRGKRNQVYLYQYAYHSSLLYATAFFNISEEAKKLIHHGDDLLMHFNVDGVTDRLGGILPDSPDEQFSKNFVRLWTSFAIHGEPKHSWGNAGYKKWKSISKREQVGLDALRWYKIAEDPTSFEVLHSVRERVQLWNEIRYSTASASDSNAGEETISQDSSKKTEL